MDSHQIPVAWMSNGAPAVMPKSKWSVAMSWYDLLFMHWPLPAGILRAIVPDELSIDTFEGTAWIGVVPFRMSGIRHRLAPPCPGLSAFAELNVRTYVTTGGQPGVWFFSLDAANAVAVWMARKTFYLPYFNAAMSVSDNGDAIDYVSRRTHRGASPSEFAARYGAVDEPFTTTPGELDHWLTARYCLYAQDRRGRVWRGAIYHEPWPLQRAWADVEANSMTRPIDIELPDTEPLLHFVRRLDVVAWPLMATRTASDQEVRE